MLAEAPDFKRGEAHKRSEGGGHTARRAAGASPGQPKPRLFCLLVSGYVDDFLSRPSLPNLLLKTASETCTGSDLLMSLDVLFWVSWGGRIS